MSKKEKKSKSNKSRSEHSNNAVQSNNHGHDANLAHECGKENCTCTKHNDCSALRQGE